MKFRQLGISDLSVSELCLGTMTWGHQNTEAEAHEQLDYATSNGINFIDTAEMYAVPPQAETYTLTEQYLGRWLQKSGKRDEFIIATKMAEPGMAWARNGEGLTPNGVAAALDGSLKRLQTDYVDLYQLHWPQRKVNSFGRRDFAPDMATGEDHILEVLQALQKQVDAGKIREVGLSNETPWGIMKYLQYHKDDANLPRMQTVQNPYSLLQREFDNHTSEVCYREQISLLPYSPLAGGILSGKYLRGEATATSRFNDWGGQRQPGLASIARAEVVQKYLDLAEAHDLNPAQMAMSFVTHRFFVASNIFGATTMAQLKVCIDSANVVLSDEVIAGIEAIHDELPNPALYNNMQRT